MAAVADVDWNTYINRLNLPSYSFYRYKRNKNINANSAAQESNIEGFSLSVISTNLKAEFETQLRNLISKRACRGSLAADSQGTVTSYTFSDSQAAEETECLCYSVLLCHDRDELSNLLAEGGSPSGSSVQSSDEFILCLLDSPHKALDLFRPELDAFSKKLLGLLEPDLLIELDLREELGQLDGLDDRLQPVLENWYRDSTQYLTHCLHKLQENTGFLLYAALSDVKLDLRLPDKQLIGDITRFVECCSLSELLSSMKSDSQSDTSSSVSENTVLVDVSGSSSQTGSKEEKLQISLDENGTLNFQTCDCPTFCEEWSDTLLSGDPNSPVFVKKVIESYKLRAIQDMNNFKRMLKLAETDYYALYRTYVFLTRSGNASMLLRHTQSEAVTTGNKETLSTINTLNNFLSESSKNEAAVQ